ncbi:hypothetical protein OG786_21070 [Streptomyces sp. NBC_00101]|uniref:hypothetical protein n=1 Tax=Streptomyces sp. NBC_00101 TaxID=2975651 RepID=UPI00324D4CBC
MRATITLNDLIETRLAEIAEDVWKRHRVLRVNHGDGRVVQLGTAAIWELWSCRANHGSGLCGEPLLTATQASSLTGMPREDGPVENPALPVIEVELLDSGVGGFLIDDLFHASDVRAEFRKVNG